MGFERLIVDELFIDEALSIGVTVSLGDAICGDEIGSKVGWHSVEGEDTAIFDD